MSNQLKQISIKCKNTNSKFVLGLLNWSRYPRNQQSFCSIIWSYRHQAKTQRIFPSKSRKPLMINFFDQPVENDTRTHHCVKSDRIRSYFGPCFPAFGLNTERYGVSLCILSKCRKIRTRITPNTDTFHAVHDNN